MMIIILMVDQTNTLSTSVPSRPAFFFFFCWIRTSIVKKEVSCTIRFLCPINQTHKNEMFIKKVAKLSSFKVIYELIIILFIKIPLFSA